MNKQEQEIQNFKESCCPFGTLDIGAAITHALAIGEDGDWLYDLARNAVEEMEYPFEDLDICYLVLDHVLQMARNDIDNKTGFDFLNDGAGKVYTYGNYMCSSYTSYEELLEELKVLFTEKGITESDLEVVTLYFLEQINFEF